MKLQIACVAAVFVLGTAAVAADTPTEGAKAEKKEKLICKTERLVGSNLPTRICMTRSERKEMEARTARKMNRLNERPPVRPPQPVSH